MLRAAEWNDWSEREILIQLAGHLRGRALQEWGLITAHERKSLEEATAVLRTRLDPSSQPRKISDMLQNGRESLLLTSFNDLNNSSSSPMGVTASARRHMELYFMVSSRRVSAMRS